MTTYTLSNATTLLRTRGNLPLEPVYPWDKTRWWGARRKYWVVLRDIPVQLSNGQTIIIEEGFRTDLSSVPQFLWGLYPPYGDFLLASLIHDWLYTHNKHKAEPAHNMTKAESDYEMFLWSCVLHKNIGENRSRLRAVKLFGRGWWEKPGQIPNPGQFPLV